MVKKLWAGRFKEETSKLVDEFTASIGVDQRLYKEDILGSIVYAKALYKAHLLTNAECKKIIKGLEEIKKGIESGKIKLKKEYEDIHMNIENLLIQKIGDIGRKIHTGRSRNDQVATDLRIYLKEEIIQILEQIKNLQRVILGLAEANLHTVMPGYTHLQRAQPILFSHYLMAYFEMLNRDKERFLECFKQADVLPLGAGALAGIGLPIDREFLARELGFSRISKNSLDAVSDRDFVVEFIASASILMMHLSRLSEELVLWSSYEFSFIEIGDAFTTGSSIMPHKKNPDVAELIRAKTGRAYGNLVRLLTILKALPLAYNKDLQEDKEGLFDTVDTVKGSLTILSAMLPSIKINKELMLEEAKKGFSTSTELVNYLVKKGVPFRKAHEIVGKIIAYCVEHNMELYYLSINDFKKFSDKFSLDVHKVVTVESSLRARDLPGGTSPERVKEAIKKAKAELR